MFGYDRDLWSKFVVGAAINYTLTLSSFRSSFSSSNPFFGDVEEGDELAYVPNHQGALTLKLEHPRDTRGS